MTDLRPLTIRSLSVNYGLKPALADIDLGVKRGEILALIGPNGAGKTTLFRAVSGVLRPKSGAVYVEGQDLNSLSIIQRARAMAVVPQARRLPAGYTVWQTVLLGRTPYLGWLGKAGPEDRERTHWALERTGTLSLASERVDELSGGEQQLVLLARALAQDTPILLLDEPTAHLDIQHQSSLLHLIQELAREQNLAIMMAIHDLNLVAQYADQVALLVKGRLKASGTPAEVLTPGNLMEVYQVPLHIVPHPIFGTPLVLLDGHEKMGQPGIKV
jgi:ABC-type cobalamin/Fe3+-siderophores transport system ATPase subunit